MSTIFHIGYHKTGTSWLQQTYFSEHPEIVFLSNYAQPWNDELLSYLIGTSDRDFDHNEAKEIFEAQIKKIPNSHRSKKVYLVSAERLSGHPFSGGYDAIRIAERLQASFPEAKIICIVRNQLDMIQSLYKQLVAEGFPGSIHELIDQKRWKTVCFDLGYLEYDKLIGKYIDLMGEEKVCVLQYEMMKKNINQFLQNICDFMEINFITTKKATTKVNKSLSNRCIPLVRRLNYFRKTELYPFPVLDIGRLYPIIKKILVKISNLFPARGLLLNKQENSMLRKRYLKTNAALATQLFKKFIDY